MGIMPIFLHLVCIWEIVSACPSSVPLRINIWGIFKNAGRRAGINGKFKNSVKDYTVQRVCRKNWHTLCFFYGQTGHNT